MLLRDSSGRRAACLLDPRRFVEATPDTVPSCKDIEVIRTSLALLPKQRGKVGFVVFGLVPLTSSVNLFKKKNLPPVPKAVELL